MATLYNTKISDTYEGLIKTFDNTGITSVLKELTDGSGNASGLFINTAGDFKVTSLLEFGSLKDSINGVIVTRFVSSTDGIENYNTNTSIPTSAAVKLYVDTKFATSDTLQEVLAFGNTTGGSDIIISSTDNVTLLGSSKTIFGTGSELEIYHDGTDSRFTSISNTYFKAPQFRVQSSIAEQMIEAFENGAVKLYYDNVNKLETTNTGVSITGILSGLTDPILAQDAATKSYVDGLDAGSDLDITDGTNTGAVNLNTQTLSILGTTNEIDAVVSGQGVTIGLPSSISTDLIGDVTGNLTGNVTGDLTGNVTATSVLTNGVTATTQASTDSSTKVATTAYVKGLDNASDLDFSGDSGIGDVNLNAQALAITGTANQIESTASNQGLSLKFPTAGVTLPNGSLATTQAAGDNSTKISTTEYVDTSAALYLPLAGGIMSGDTTHNDSVKSIYGTGSDAQVYHDGSNFYANNSTGQLNIDQSAVTESIVFKTSNANSLDTTGLIINRAGDLITGNDVTIAGNLTVNGTTTTVNSQTLSVEDPLISLATANAANSLDIGFYGKYNDGTTRYTGLFNDASDTNTFRLFKGTTVEPTTTVNIGGAGYEAADLIIAGLTSTTGTFSASISAAGNSNSLGNTTTAALSTSSISSTGSLAISGNSNSIGITTFTGALTGTSANFGGGNHPTGQLVISGGASYFSSLTTANRPVVEIKTDSTTKAIIAATYFGTGSYPSLSLQTGGADRLTIDASGNSTFKGETYFNKGIRLYRYTDQANFWSLYTNTDDSLRLNYNGSGGDELTIDSSGNTTLSGSLTGTSASFSGNIELKSDSGNATKFLRIWNQGTAAADDAVLSWKAESSRIYSMGIHRDSGHLVIAAADASVASGGLIDITSGGNVGIGTDSPDAKLQIGDYSSASDVIITALGGDGPDGTIRNRLDFTLGSEFSVNPSDAYIFSIGLNAGKGTDPNYSYNSDFVIRRTTRLGVTDNVDFLISGATGNVGIGTDSPQAKLHVGGGQQSSLPTYESTLIVQATSPSQGANSIGGIELPSTSTGYGTKLSTKNSSDSFSISTRFNSPTWVDRLTIQQVDGNVGIGTDSPIDTLHVAKSGTGGLQRWGTNEGGALVLSANENSANPTWKFLTGSGEKIQLDPSNNNSGLTVAYSGNVGIGTDSPTSYGASYKNLDVVGSSGAYLTLKGTTTAVTVDFAAETTTGYIGTKTAHPFVFRTGDVERMRIDSSGDIQIKNGSVLGGEIKLTGGDNDLTLNGQRGETVFQIAGTTKMVLDANQLYPQADNTMKLGLSGQRWSIVYAVSGVNTSDETLKENIKECNLGIDFINSLKPKSYNLKDLKEDNDAYGKKRYGLIAQDILKTELKDSVFGKKDGEYGLSYNDLIAPMIKAMQEQQIMIQELQAEVEILKQR